MEHNTPSNKSNPAKHLRDSIDHSFQYVKVPMPAHRFKSSDWSIL